MSWRSIIKDDSEDESDEPYADLAPTDYNRGYLERMKDWQRRGGRNRLAERYAERFRTLVSDSDREEFLFVAVDTILLDFLSDYYDEVKNNISKVGSEWDSLIQGLPMTIKGNIGRKIIEEIFEQILLPKYNYPVLKIRESIYRYLTDEIGNNPGGWNRTSQEFARSTNKHDEFFGLRERYWPESEDGTIEGNQGFAGIFDYEYRFNEDFYKKTYTKFQKDFISLWESKTKKNYTIKILDEYTSDIKSKLDRVPDSWYAIESSTMMDVHTLLREVISKLPLNIRRQNIIYGSVKLPNLDAPDIPVAFTLDSLFNGGIVHAFDEFYKFSYFAPSQRRRINMEVSLDKYMGIMRNYNGELNNAMVQRITDEIDDLVGITFDWPKFELSHYAEGERPQDNYEGLTLLIDEQLRAEPALGAGVNTAINNVMRKFTNALREDIDFGASEIENIINNALEGVKGVDAPENIDKPTYDKRMYTYGELQGKRPEGKELTDVVYPFTDRTKRMVESVSIEEVESPESQLEGFTISVDDTPKATLFYKMVGQYIHTAGAPNRGAGEISLLTQKDRDLLERNQVAIRSTRLKDNLKSKYRGKSIIPVVIVSQWRNPQLTGRFGDAAYLTNPTKEEVVSQFSRRESREYKYDNPADLVATSLVGDLEQDHENIELIYHAPSERHLVAISMNFPWPVKTNRVSINEALTEYLLENNVADVEGVIHYMFARLQVSHLAHENIEQNPELNRTEINRNNKHWLLDYYWEGMEQGHGYDTPAIFKYLKYVKSLVENLPSDVSPQVNLDELYNKLGIEIIKYSAKLYLDVLGASRAKYDRSRRTVETEYGRYKVTESPPHICMYSSLGNVPLSETSRGEVCILLSEVTPIADAVGTFDLILNQWRDLLNDAVQDKSKLVTQNSGHPWMFLKRDRLFSQNKSRFITGYSGEWTNEGRVR